MGFSAGLLAGGTPALRRCPPRALTEYERLPGRRGGCHVLPQSLRPCGGAACRDLRLPLLGGRRRAPTDHALRIHQRQRCLDRPAVRAQYGEDGRAVRLARARPRRRPVAKGGRPVGGAGPGPRPRGHLPTGGAVRPLAGGLRHRGVPHHLRRLPRRKAGPLRRTRPVRVDTASRRGVGMLGEVVGARRPALPPALPARRAPGAGAVAQPRPKAPAHRRLPLLRKLSRDGRRQGDPLPGRGVPSPVGAPHRGRSVHLPQLQLDEPAGAHRDP